MCASRIEALLLPADYPDDVSGELRAAAVPLLSQEKCRGAEIYGGRRQPILDSMLCAGRLNGGVDACAGDSGGPLACKRNGEFHYSPPPPPAESINK